jgi:caffeoyl-CoA O-methyltransferase
MAITRNKSADIDYITRTFVREPNYIAMSRAAGEQRRPGMQISAYEGHLLQWLVRISGAKNILEIGTFMGTSTLWMAAGLPENGIITTLEFSEEYAALARQHFAASPLVDRIEMAQGPALDWFRTRPAVPQFDLVFIDADKNNYANYLEEVLPRMNKRGWIIGDNTLLFGVMSGEKPDGASPVAKEAMTKFNETLADPARFESILLPTVEGMTLARLR